MFWKALKIFIFVITMPLLILILAILHNNIGDSDYSQDELNNAFNQSVNWLQKNNHAIQNEHNSMLW